MLLAVAVATTITANAQVSTGEIHGRILEKAGGYAPLSNTIVWVNVAGSARKSGLDDEGRFLIKPLDAGTYIVHIAVVERGDTIKKQVNVKPNEILSMDNIYLDQEETSTEMDEVEIVAEKLIDIDQPAVLKMNAKQLEHMPVKRNIKELIAVMSSDVKTIGGNSYIRGSRADAVLYVIDGVKQSDKVISVPGSAINNVMVYTGGVPAKYGDCTGGVVIVETKSYFNLYYEWLSKQ